MDNRGQFSKGLIPWNKGLSKKTNPVVARVAEMKIGKKRPDITGEKHPRWKNGATSESTNIRNSKAYGRWRDAVYQRDNYTCCDCDKRGGKLIAHHKEHFAVAKNKRLDVDNGITLCVSCHFKRHPDNPALKAKAKSAEHKRSLSESAKLRWSNPDERRKQSERRKAYQLRATQAPPENM